MCINRKHTLKWLFSQEKATFHCSRKVYVNSENALNPMRSRDATDENHDNSWTYRRRDEHSAGNAALTAQKARGTVQDAS